MAKRRIKNLLALAVLAILTTGEAMHPYQMAQVLRRTGKERDMRIKWGSLYTVVANLEKHGLIEATGSSRSGRRPERTEYAITDAGRAELTDWLREIVGVPEPERTRFVAALSVIVVLPPDEVATLLDQRIQALEQDIAAQRAALEEAAGVPRVFLIENEYELAMRTAEAEWVRALRADLASGSLEGVDGWRAYHESGTPSFQWTEVIEEGDQS